MSLGRLGNLFCQDRISHANSDEENCKKFAIERQQQAHLGSLLRLQLPGKRDFVFFAPQYCGGQFIYMYLLSVFSFDQGRGRYGARGIGQFTRARLLDSVIAGGRVRGVP